MSFQRFKQWLNQMFIPLPATDRMRVEGLTNLKFAGRPHHAVVCMKLEAGRVPLEPDKVDEPAGLTIEIADEIFIRKIEPFKWF